MFRELMNFSYQRTALQALGWYLTFLLIGLALGAIAGAIFATGAASFAEGAQRGILAGRFINPTYHMILAVALLWTRWWKAVLNIFLALAAVLLSVFFGSLGGLIPLAVLTTRPRHKSRKEIGEVFN
jgi:hypothetical protein